MVMSIPDPVGSAKTIVAFQHLDALCALDREAITGRLLKKFRLLTHSTPARRDAPFRGQGRSE